ncbi:MAG: cell division protein FtsZ [Betaproteobacteria bacterium]|jgi:cell division protein FtsZ|nr:cell division protein FtsZ [Nitrosomonadales bacterium]NCV38219.1 cell division protein FtsZ [Betaproteobacteria bacterium]NCV53548.1 cell division protein FtsZ [Betaproteobacteria bacterium]NCW63503.1 cell division protein FtsZ [Betaproteobacteria bacterium]
MFEVIDNKKQEALIKVVGVGGCGNNAVDYMIERNIHGVDFISVNTDLQSLKKSQANNIVQIGLHLTKGLGSGARPDAGKQAAIEDKEKLKDAIQDADMLFITAGMGGGTGTGAAPVIAEIAKELGILTVAVVTKPFSFEGKRNQIAEEGLKELRSYVDSLIVIPNEKLMNVLGADVTFINAFSAANEVLYNSVSGISDIINHTGLINVDFSDVKTVMAEMGSAIIGSGIFEGDNRAVKAAQLAINSPLLENIELKNAKGILVNISASSSFKMKEYIDVMNEVKSITANDATVIVGNVIDDELENKIKVTIVATGLDDNYISEIKDQPSISDTEVIDDNQPSDNLNTVNVIEKPQSTESDFSNVFFDGGDESNLVDSGAVSEDEYDIPSFLRRNK